MKTTTETMAAISAERQRRAEFESVIDVPAWREAISKATPGPWSSCGAERGGCSCGLVWTPHAAVACTMLDERTMGGECIRNPANAAAIVHMRNTYEKLLDEVDRLRALDAEAIAAGIFCRLESSTEKFARWSDLGPEMQRDFVRALSDAIADANKETAK